MFLFDEVGKSHYETLGIGKTAGDTEIKRAYFGLVRKYQPDRFPEQFKQIRAAYETLSDRKKRDEYDAIGDLPPSAAPLFHEAQRLDHFGRHDKAAKLYENILKRYPGLDNVREQYANSLLEDDKTGKASEVWEELCRRHPDKPRYARKLGIAYFERGWNKKALAEARRAVSLERGSIDGWSLLLSCTIRATKGNPNFWEELEALTAEAVEAVKGVKTDEWEKIYLYIYAFISCGTENSGVAKEHIRELVRLVREGGRKGREEGQRALKEITRSIPVSNLTAFYPELREMADLLPDPDDESLTKLDDIRLEIDIEGLEQKKYSELFHDLFSILNTESEDDADELEVIAMECAILDDRNLYVPQIKRLKEEFPELYFLHGSFFNEVLRTRDPEKLLYQRVKKYKRLKRKTGIVYDEDDEPDSAPPEPFHRAQPKVGRNDPCPCGSGKKYKKCCGA